MTDQVILKTQADLIMWISILYLVGRLLLHYSVALLGWKELI